MDDIKIFKRCYKLSCLIIDYYTELLGILATDKSYNIKSLRIMKEINRLLILELEQYNKLSKESVESIANKLSEIPSSELSLNDIRVISKLHLRFDILSGKMVKNGDLFSCIDKDDNLSIVGIVNSKIMIDTFKLLEKKLTSLTCNTQEERKFRDNLLLYNHQHALLKLNFHYVSEKLALISCYDLFLVPMIDLKLVEDKIYNDTGEEIDVVELARNGIFSDFISFLDSLENTTFSHMDAENIYDNFYFVSYIEILLPYLSKQQLQFINSYINGVKFNSKMIENNVKSLVRNRMIKVFGDD